MFQFSVVIFLLVLHDFHIPPSWGLTWFLRKHVPDMVFQINNLENPYGNCKDLTLEHTSYYTTEECYMSCLTKIAKTVCGCRDMFMPNAYGEWTFHCTIIIGYITGSPITLLHVKLSHVMTTCFCHMRTTKAQISLRIRAV